MTRYGEGTRPAETTEKLTEKSSDEPLATFSEQLAQQLGGVRGLAESGIPVAVFVLANVAPWFTLRTAVIIAVASAVVIAIIRLMRRETVRHAVNGVLGVAVGAYLVWHTGSAKEFYLPGIVISFAYGVAMLASVVIRRPLIGWVWSLLAAGGSTSWREQPALVRLFSWLTVVWSVTYLAKTAIQTWLFQSTAANDPATALGIAKLVLGYPIYALLLALTVWSVRRVTGPARRPAA
jgi:Protein of unknown function (DUF3159)